MGIYDHTASCPVHVLTSPSVTLRKLRRSLPASPSTTIPACRTHLPCSFRRWRRPPDYHKPPLASTSDGRRCIAACTGHRRHSRPLQSLTTRKKLSNLTPRAHHRGQWRLAAPPAICFPPPGSPSSRLLQSEGKGICTLHRNPGPLTASQCRPSLI
jgi:hypothetical protein